MSHDHHHHDHHDAKRLKWATCLTGGFMVVEAVGGLLSGSLALLADAGHMLTDTAALALAWMALAISRKPPDAQRTYGYHRMQVLVAFVNGLALFVIVGWIVFEAIDRFLEPVPILGMPMLLVAAAGLVVNLAAFAILHGAQPDNINIRGAALHVLGDLLGSIGAIGAAVIILLTGWTPIDPLLSMLVAALILRSAWRVVAESGHILLEGSPPHLDVEALKSGLREAVPAVEDIHHVHLWSLSPGKVLLTAHARLAPNSDSDATLLELKRVLADEYDLSHSTVEVISSDSADPEPSCSSIAGALTSH